MKRNYPGCAICDSTWGNVWEEVEGERLFFCCTLCVRQYRRLLERLHSVTGGTAIERIDIEGGRTGRRVAVESTGGRRTFFVRFTTEGEILEFRSDPDAPAVVLSFGKDPGSVRNP